MFFSFYFVFGFISGLYVAQEYNVPNVRKTFEKIRTFINETNLNNKINELEKTFSKNSVKYNTTNKGKEEQGESCSEESGSELDLELSEEEEEQSNNDAKKTH